MNKQYTTYNKQKQLKYLKWRQTKNKNHITNCAVRWPHSVHDSHIPRESHIHWRFLDLVPDGIPLGDSGCPLLRWLTTPFANVTNDSQLCHSEGHSSTSGTECIKGVLKHRFATLNYFGGEPKKACKRKHACTVLHNLAETQRVSLYEARQIYHQS